MGNSKYHNIIDKIYKSGLDSSLLFDEFEKNGIINLPTIISKLDSLIFSLLPYYHKNQGVSISEFFINHSFSHNQVETIKRELKITSEAEQLLDGIEKKIVCSMIKDQRAVYIVKQREGRLVSNLVFGNKKEDSIYIYLINDTYYSFTSIRESYNSLESYANYIDSILSSRVLQDYCDRLVSGISKNNLKQKTVDIHNSLLTSLSFAELVKNIFPDASIYFYIHELAAMEDQLSSDMLIKILRNIKRSIVKCLNEAIFKQINLLLNKVREDEKIELEKDIMLEKKILAIHNRISEKNLSEKIRSLLNDYAFTLQVNLHKNFLQCKSCNELIECFKSLYSIPIIGKIAEEAIAIIQALKLNEKPEKFDHLKSIIASALTVMTIDKNPVDNSILEISANNAALSTILSQQQFNPLDPIITEIRIHAQGILYIDCNFEYFGKNLVLLANKINIIKPAIINISGKNAELCKEKKARNGEKVRLLNNAIQNENDVNGTGGEIGQDGNAGQSSGNLYIEGELINSSALTVIANGGNGADGQEGGDGEKGKDGKDGRDAEEENLRSVIHFMRAAYIVKHKDKLGIAGGRGGDAGRGGFGGEGGYPGRVIINGDTLAAGKKSCPEGTPFDNKFNIQLHCQAGNDGKNANHGQGGLGGKGGRCGADYGCQYYGYLLDTKVEKSEHGEFWIKVTHHWYGDSITLERNKTASKVHEECAQDGEIGANNQMLVTQGQVQKKTTKNCFRSIKVEGEKKQNFITGGGDLQTDDVDLADKAKKIQEKVNATKLQQTNLKKQTVELENIKQEIAGISKKILKQLKEEYAVSKNTAIGRVINPPNKKNKNIKSTNLGILNSTTQIRVKNDNEWQEFYITLNSYQNKIQPHIIKKLEYFVVMLQKLSVSNKYLFSKFNIKNDYLLIIKKLLDSKTNLTRMGYVADNFPLDLELCIDILKQGMQTHRIINSVFSSNNNFDSVAQRIYLFRMQDQMQLNKYSEIIFENTKNDNDVINCKSTITTIITILSQQCCIELASSIVQTLKSSQLKLTDVDEIVIIHRFEDIYRVVFDDLYRLFSSDPKNLLNKIIKFVDLLNNKITSDIDKCVQVNEKDKSKIQHKMTFLSENNDELILEYYCGLSEYVNCEKHYLAKLPLILFPTGSVSDRIIEMLVKILKQLNNKSHDKNLLRDLKFIIILLQKIKIKDAKLDEIYQQVNIIRQNDKLSESASDPDFIDSLMYLNNFLYSKYNLQLADMTAEIQEMAKSRHLSSDHKEIVNRIFKILQEQSCFFSDLTVTRDNLITFIEQQSTLNNAACLLKKILQNLAIKVTTVEIKKYNVDDKLISAIKDFNKNSPDVTASHFSQNLVNSLDSIISSKHDLQKNQGVMVQCVKNIYIRHNYLVFENNEINNILHIKMILNNFRQKIINIDYYNKSIIWIDKLNYFIDDYIDNQKEQINVLAFGIIKKFIKTYSADSGQDEFFGIFKNLLQNKNTTELDWIICVKFLELNIPYLYDAETIKLYIHIILNFQKMNPNKFYYLENIFHIVLDYYFKLTLDMTADSKVEEVLLSLFDELNLLRQYVKNKIDYAELLFEFLHDLILNDVPGDNYKHIQENLHRILVGVLKIESANNANSTLNECLICLIMQCGVDTPHKTKLALILLKLLKQDEPLFERLIPLLDKQRQYCQDQMEMENIYNKFDDVDDNNLREIIFTYYKTKFSQHELSILDRLINSNLSFHIIDQIIKEALSFHGIDENRILLTLYKKNKHLNADNLEKKKDLVTHVFSGLLSLVEKNYFNHLLAYVRTSDELEAISTELLNVQSNEWEIYLWCKLTRCMHKKLLSQIGLRKQTLIKRVKTLKNVGSDVIEKLFLYCNTLFDYQANQNLAVENILHDLENISVLPVGSNQIKLFDSIIDDMMNLLFLYNAIKKVLGKYEATTSIEIIEIIYKRYIYHTDSKYNMESVVHLLTLIGNNDRAQESLNIIKNSLPANWINYLAYNQLSHTVLIFLNNGKIQAQCIDEIPPDFSALLVIVKTNASLMQVFNKKLEQENKLINQESKLSIADFKRILIYLSQGFDESSIRDLDELAVVQWEFYLKRQMMLSKAIQNVPERWKQEFSSKLNNLLENCDLSLALTFIDSIIYRVNPDYQKIINSMQHFSKYPASFTQQNINYLSNNPESGWQSFLNKAQQPAEKELTLDELVDAITLELKHTENDNSPDILTAEILKNHVLNINHYFDCNEAVWLRPSKPIKALDINDIKQWLSYVQSNRNIDANWIQKNSYQVIAVIMRGVEIHMKKKFRVRNTQLLALWLYLNAANNQQGRLGQVATGEGKTIIIAMFVIIQALSNKQINVITSSSVLAKRDAELNKELFGFFGINVSNNCDEVAQTNMEERQKRYVAQVVYGDVGSFQRDILLTKFMGQNVLGNRSDEIIVVDEVDSMLLDKNDSTLYLSHEMPDLRHLMHLYIVIWCAVHDPAIDTSNNPIEEVSQYIRNMISNGEIPIPNFLHDFVEYRISSWIEMAFLAKQMPINEQYVVAQDQKSKDGSKIVIVDKDTGVEQVSTQWSNGLHQFIQLLNTRKLSYESLKSVYMSNLSYFQNYKGKIYGITGTLGLSTEKKLLTQIYQVDFFNLPRFKNLLFKEEKGIVVTEEKKWLELIANDVKEKILKKRSLLIISENPKNAQLIQSYLSKSLNRNDIELYISSFKEFALIAEHKQLPPNKIIVSTNLAGRGTDLIINDELASHDGLQVILTYMPPNIRIEEQAFGRAARQGQKGSGKYIVKDPMITDLAELRALRDKEAMQKTEDFRTQGLQAVEIEQKLFVQFGETHKMIKDELSKHYKSTADQKLIEIQLQSLKCHWAFWLDTMDEKIRAVTTLGIDVLMTEYAEFHDEMLELVRKNDLFKLVQLPHELTKLAKYYEKVNKFDDAISCLDKVIIQEPKYAEIACLQKAKILSKISSSYHSRVKIKEALKSAKILICDRIQDLTFSSSALDKVIELCKESEHGKLKNDFKIQVKNEIELFRIHLCAIENILGTEFSATVFNNIASLSDQDKSADLFKNLISNSNVVKNFRLSKKLKIEKTVHGNELYIKHNDCYHNIILPLSLSYCGQSILNKITDKMSDQNLLILPDDFKDIVVSQRSLWDLLIKNRFLQLSHEFGYLINIDHRKLSELEFGFQGKMLNDSMIKEILSNNDQLMFTKELFPMLTPTQFSSVKTVLCKANLLSSVNKGCLSFSYRHDIQKLILPDILRPYADLLISLFNEQINGLSSETKRCTLTRDIYISDLSLLEDNARAQDVLWNSLLDQGVVKSHRIKFSLRETSNNSNFETRFSVIKSEVQATLKNLFPENDKLIQPVMQIIEQCIGKLKSLKEFKVGEKNLKEFFTKGEYPPEMEKFANLLFDDVFILELKPSYWNWSAFAVGLLGMAQIAAGIALELCTSGLGATLGAILISEGVSDIIYAVHSTIMGNFSWKDYGIHKSISLLTSVVTVMTFGIGAGFSVGLQTARGTALQALKYTAQRVGVEVVKAASIKISGLALEKISSHLPQEIHLRLGDKIKLCINNSDKIKDKALSLSKIMTSLLSAMPDKQEAQNYIDQQVSEILSESEGNPVYKQIVSTIFSVTEQVPTQILLSAGTTKAFLLATLVSCIINGVEHSIKFHQLINIIPNAFLMLEKKLKIKYDEEIKKNSHKNIDKTALHQDYVEKTISKTKEQLTTLMLSRMTKEMLVPNLTKHINNAINKLGNQFQTETPAQIIRRKKAQEFRAAALESYNAGRQRNQYENSEYASPEIDSENIATPTTEILPPEEVISQPEYVRPRRVRPGARENIPVNDEEIVIVDSTHPDSDEMRSRENRRLRQASQDWKGRINPMPRGEAGDESRRRLYRGRNPEGRDLRLVRDANLFSRYGRGRGRMRNRDHDDPRRRYRNTHRFPVRNESQQMSQLSLRHQRRQERINALTSTRLRIDRIQNVSNDVKFTLLNHSLIILRECFVAEIKKSIKKNTQNEIARIKQQFNRHAKNYETQERLILEEKKNLIKNFIALVLVDKKISAEITKAESLFSAEGIIKEAEFICNECFQQSQHERRSICLINYLNKNYLKDHKDHSDVSDLLNEIKRLFREYDLNKMENTDMLTKKKASKTDDKLVKYEDKPTDIANTSTSPSTLTNVTQMTVGVTGAISTTMQSISNVLTEREKSRQEIIKANTEIANKTLETINNLGKQVQGLVKSQSEVIQTSTDKFVKLCERLKEASPEALEKIRAERMEKEVTHYRTQADKAYGLVEKNPDNPNFFKMWEKTCADVIAKEDKIDLDLREKCSTYVKAVDASMVQFSNLMRELKISDNKVIVQAMELQQNMVEAAKKLLNITPKSSELSILPSAGSTQTTTITPLPNKTQIAKHAAPTVGPLDDTPAKNEKPKQILPKAPAPPISVKTPALFKAKANYAPRSDEIEAIKESFNDRAPFQFKKGDKFTIFFKDGQAELCANEWIKARKGDCKSGDKGEKGVISTNYLSKI